MAYKLIKLLGFSLATIVLSGALFVAVADEETSTDAAPAEATKEVVKAEAGTKKKEVKENVQTGILASQVNAGLSASVDVSTDGVAPGETPGVIAASVSVADRNTCVVRVINNGKKSYSISYELVAKDYSGAKKFTRFFSSTVGPGKSVEQRASGCTGKLNLFVDVKSAKPL